MILWFGSLVAAQEYLVPSRVQERLIQEVPKMESCFAQKKRVSILLSFSILQTGELVVDNVDECSQILEAVTFPPHPQARNEYQWSLVVQDQKLFPVQFTEKSTEQLLPGLFSLQKQALLEALMPKESNIEKDP